MTRHEPQGQPDGALAGPGGPISTPDGPSWLRTIEHGSGDPPPQGRLVRFGPFTAVLLGAELRYLCVGEREIIRRIHVAVRDPAWETIEPSLRTIDVNQGADGLEVSADLRHSAEPLAFDCTVGITGSAAGLEYTMSGTCRSDFGYNRIGICVLLPPAGYAGARYVAVGPSGATSGALPELIGPQLIEGELILPLFPAFERLGIALPGDHEIEFGFAGDLFEMEDQRNWTDASFKIYSTPLALPRPRMARSGDNLRQSLSMRVRQLPT